MPEESRKRALFRELVDQILYGEGQAPAELRAQAYENEVLPPPLDALVGKVVAEPATVTARDFAEAKASGFSEDELFEVVVCAAVGQAARLYETGLAALKEAH